MNPRIYVGALEEAVYTMSETENASFPLANLSTYIPTELWKSSAATNGQTLKIDFGAARPRNFCILHGHNFGGMTTVSLQAADDSGYASGLVTVVSSLVHPLSVVKFEFDPVNKRYWRILFTDCNAVIPELGQIFIDQKIDFVQHYDWGFRPRNEDFESVVTRPTINGIMRSARTYSGRMRYGFGWKKINNRTLEDIRWWLQKVQGGFAPFYFYDHNDERYYVRNTKNYSPASVAAFKVNDSAFFEVETLDVNQVPYTQQTNPMAVDLDGSTEYCSKSSPVNLDMNGSEQIINTGFDVNLDNWASQGNHSGLRITSDSQSGIACMEVTATGPGDSSANRVYGTVTPETTNTKKYTIEFWAKSVSGSTSLNIFLGGASQTFALTTSWAKYVLNTASSNGGSGLVFYLSASGVFRLDVVSVSEAYDFTVLAWVKRSIAVDDAERIIHRRNATTGTGFFLRVETSPLKYSFYLQSAVQTAEAYSQNAPNVVGLWVLLAATVNRMGSLILFTNGVAGTPIGISNIGNLRDSASLNIGTGDGTFWTGQIGELQIIRGYAMTAAQVLDIYQQGIRKSYDQKQYPGATVVAHYRWRGTSDTEFLKDETGWNNLTGTGITQPNNQIIADYPIIEL